MASILSNFEYDIFISYRQKDNKGDHWVTEFVDALKAELEATFKESISVYFDVNSNDGLLETHIVHKSLEGKLKCLIFIPIISQTYCDTTSFAWQHEFCAFKLLAADDQLGLEIVLAHGNVASRILPIKIHAIDDRDNALLETELAGPIRGVDFIYKEAGVNRPLKPTDNKNDNQNKTDYRNQINKTANAIKEIISALTQPVPHAEVRSAHLPPKKVIKKRKLLALAATLFIVVSVGTYFFYARSPAPPPAESGLSNSVAVLPFVNMSNDPEQEYFTDGITEQIITNLSHISSLKVIARTSVMKFKKTNKSIAEIGKELNVTHVLEGSIRKLGDHIRVTGQLISVNGEVHIWAQDYDRNVSDIFDIQDEISEAITKSLQRKLTPREFENFKSDRSANLKAYEHQLKGRYLQEEIYEVNSSKTDFFKSEMEFKEAIHLDTTYALAYAGLASLYDDYAKVSATTDEETRIFEAKRDFYSQIAFKLRPNNAYILITRSYTFEKENNSDAYLDSIFAYRKKAIHIAPNSAFICNEVADFYFDIGLINQALALQQRAAALDPTDATYYARMTFSYMALGDLYNAKKASQKAMLIQPEGIQSLSAWALVCLSTRSLAEGKKTIERINQLHPGIKTDYLGAYLAALKGEKKEDALAKFKAPTIYLALGMKKEALESLEATKRPRYLYLKYFSGFEELRSDPRFVKILEKARLLYDVRLRKYAN